MLIIQKYNNYSNFLSQSPNSEIQVMESFWKLCTWAKIWNNTYCDKNWAICHCWD